MKRIINNTKQTLLLLVLLLVAACTEDVGLDQHGHKVLTDSLTGQWLVVNYWAQWCAPCRQEIPELNQLSQELQGQPVQVIGVNFDGLQGESLRAASTEMLIEFRVLAADPAARYGIERAKVLPVTYIIGPDGQVSAELLGEQTAQGLREHLQTLGALTLTR